MCDASGQLADRVNLLCFEKLGKRLFALMRALLDAQFELLIELLQSGARLFEIGRPLGDALLEIRVQPLECACLAIQFREDAHFGAQYLRHHRHRHVIDPARFISPEPVQIRQVNGGDENQRRLLKAGVLADHRGELEAVQVRHLDVDQHDRDFELQEVR